MNNHIENIEAALTAVQEAHAEYIGLHNAYVAAMQSKHGYEAVEGADEHRANVALDMIAAGELTAKGIARAIESGLIQKQSAKKSDELVQSEATLQAATNEYNRLCVEAILPYQFTKTRSPRGNTEGTSGEPGPGKKSEVISMLRAIDPAIVVNFNGRRVFGTLGNGASFDYDVYGQSYVQSIAKMVTKA